MATQQGQAFEDLRNTVSECGRIVRHRWRLALVGLCTVGALAFWYSQYLPREYAAATIFERRDDVVLQNLIQSNSPYGFSHLKTTMKMDMIGSRALADAAVRLELLPAETFDGDGALSDDERAAIEKVLTEYKLKPKLDLLHSSPSLDTILLQCDANNATMASEFVTALRDNYIESTRDRIRGILSSSRKFFESEVERLQKEIAAVEHKLRRDFEEFPGLDPTDLPALGARLEALRREQEDDHRQVVELEAQIEAHERFLSEVPDFVTSAVGPQPAPSIAAAPQQPKPAVDPALDQTIQNVQSQIVELVTGKKMTMEHPRVQALFDKLESLETIRETICQSAPALEPVATAVGPPAVVAEAVPKPVREWQIQQKRIELELDSFRRRLEVAEKQANESTERAQRFAALYEGLIDEGDDLKSLREQRQTQSSEMAVWQQHLAQLDRLLTAESGQRGTQFSLIEEPKDVQRPTRPRVASIFVVCSGLGLAAAALLVALAELFDRSFRSVGQATRVLGIPVLECVGVIPTPKERRKTLISRMVWAPVVTVLIFALVTSALLAYTSIARPHLHARTMQRVDGVLNTMGIASALPHENSL